MAEYSEARELGKALGIRRSWTNLTIIAEALKRGIAVTAEQEKPRIALTHNGITHRWGNGRNSLNSELSRRIGWYKDVQSRLFRNQGINAPENAVFTSGQAERAWQWAEPLGRLVVKPHDGTHGKNVHVGIGAWEDFAYAFEHVAAYRDQVLVEKFLPGVEHRCLMVDHKLVAVTRRRPASVFGDGTSTIAELVERKNRRRGRIHKPIQLGDLERRHLGRKGRDFDTVPDEGRRVFLLGTSNIHAGGDAIDATTEVTADERTLIEEASLAVPGMRVVGLDVLLPRKGRGSEVTIIEANTAPMTSMHHFPWVGEKRNVSAPILDAMFPETRSE